MTKYPEQNGPILFTVKPKGMPEDSNEDFEGQYGVPYIPGGGKTPQEIKEKKQARLQYLKEYRKRRLKNECQL